MSSTEDTKSPIEALTEAAEVLKRETSPLTGEGSEVHRKVKQAVGLKKLAANLKRVANGLRWIDEPLGWVGEPLERTAAALIKLTPADLAEAKIALEVTADGLKMVAEAVSGLGIINGTCATKKLDGIEKNLPEWLPEQLRRLRPMVLISNVLKQASDALRSDYLEDWENAYNYLEVIATAIENAKAAEPAQNS